MGAIFICLDAMSTLAQFIDNGVPQLAFHRGHFDAEGSGRGFCALGGLPRPARLLNRALGVTTKID
jgi:hypothetical protein